MTDRYKLIAKNTALLYIRMLVILGVNFYTIRVVIDVLGVSDFGIYNLIAGFVIILAFLNNTLATGTQRFLTFEIGKKDFLKLKQTFSSSLMIHTILAILILIAAETIGLWLFYEKLVIPAERLEAAFWAYQFSVFTIMVTVTQVPYVALIIAHERMHIFAYISILEAALKLIMVYLLQVVSYDKLIVYAALMFVVSMSITFYYRRFCHLNYMESHFKFAFDREILKPMLKFSGWNVFGSIGALVATQGIAVLLNMFFGPVANAAHAIAVQVSNGMNQFVNNFQTAMTPQITKLYAKNEIEELNSFLYQNSKYSFLLLWLLALPAFLKLEFLMSLWLTVVPQYSIIFTKLLLVYGLMYALLRPLIMAVQATGKIKGVQLSAGILLIAVFPISYILLINDFPPSSPFIVMLMVWLFHLFIELFFLKKYIGFSSKFFLKYSILPVLAIVVISFVLSEQMLSLFADNLLAAMMFFLVTLTLNFILIYLIGLNYETRKKLYMLVENKLTKKRSIL